MSQPGLLHPARWQGLGLSMAAICLYLMTGLITLLVLARYGLGWSSVASAEAAMYLHALVITLGLGATLRRDGHVRIDIFYRRWSAKRRLAMDRLGVALLAAPFCVFMLWASWDYVALAWARQESSAEPGGLPWLWLLKTLLLVFPLQLLLAAVLLAWRGPLQASAE